MHHSTLSGRKKERVRNVGKYLWIGICLVLFHSSAFGEDQKKYGCIKRWDLQNDKSYCKCERSQTGYNSLMECTGRCRKDCGDFNNILDSSDGRAGAEKAPVPLKK